MKTAGVISAQRLSFRSPLLLESRRTHLNSDSNNPKTWNCSCKLHSFLSAGTSKIGATDGTSYRVMPWRAQARTPWGKLTGLEAIVNGNWLKNGRFRRKPSPFRALPESNQASGAADSDGAPSVALKRTQIAVSAAITVVLAVLNRVLYKLALVPLQEYPFFLAQVTTFGYVLVYFGILSYRRKVGIVTDDMLDVPKMRFAAMGALEALGLASGMAAAAVLPGALIPILSQVFLAWQLGLSYFLLNKRYTVGQLLGCATVVAGVIIVVASGSGAGEALTSAGLFWPLVMIVSAAFPAGSSILKELVFKDAKERLQGRSLDLFVVNSFGSGFQALFVFLLLPLLSRMRGIPFHQLPEYFAEGTGCLLNMGSLSPSCEGAPWLPVLYVACNLAFNISALHLLKISSAIVASLSITLAVPLTIFMFTFPLPYLGRPAPLPPGFFSGSVVLVLGLLIYNTSGVSKLPSLFSKDRPKDP